MPDVRVEFPHHAKSLSTQCSYQKDLRRIARARLEDAKVLFQAGRYDGSLYLCGYAIELTLKARICITLQWTGFPETAKEFENKRGLKTHDLDTLLDFTGRKNAVGAKKLTEWMVVSTWDPERRYKLIGSVSPAEAELMIRSVESLLKVL